MDIPQKMLQATRDDPEEGAVKICRISLECDIQKLESAKDE
jgi:hypothetical protein